jgi:sulfur relay (sulfurtransferase) DsrC/TusE family protein
MNIDISKQEAWKIIDAIKAYTKDYSVSGAVNKTFTNVINKLEKVVND